MSAKTDKKPKIGARILNSVERLGNKLPDPFVLFILLALIIIVISAIAGSAGASVTNPGTGEDEPIKNLLSAEGIEFILTSMLDNFTGFAPLGLVLAIMLGIGLTEQVGYLDYAIRKTVQRLPAWVLPYGAVFVGINGNLASDAAMVVIPPLTALVFYKVGRHPIAGIAAGFAGSGIGFTASLFVAGTDALLAGISTEAASIIDDSIKVTPVANWYFNIASIIILTIVGGLVTTLITEKRLGTYTGDAVEDEGEDTPREHRGLLLATGLGLLYVVIIAVAVLIPTSPLRGEDGSIIDSPFLDGIIPLILGLFIVVGLTYGLVVGKITSTKDISKHMATAISRMSGYIVMIFAIAQFIEYFNWSNLGLWLAVNGAGLLETAGFTGILLVISYVVFTALLNFFIPSGSAKWALEAPIFVPLFMQLGYHPGFAQVAYRIADSSTNMVTPLSPYLPIVLGFIRRYDKKAGIGTYISLMLPYTIAFLSIWIILLLVFFFTGIPYGPGVTTYL